MGSDGVGPSTSSLSEKRSTAELATQKYSLLSQNPEDFKRSTKMRHEPDSNRRMTVLQTVVLTTSPSCRKAKYIKQKTILKAYRTGFCATGGGFLNQIVQR